MRPSDHTSIAASILYLISSLVDADKTPTLCQQAVQPLALRQRIR